MTGPTPRAAAPLTRASIFAQAWPIMLGQASVPMVGIVDAAVIGRTGDTTALAGVALGAAIISLVFWSFGFLRMGITGLTAQADGAGNHLEVHALLLRALALGGFLGAALLVLQWPIGHIAFSLLSSSPEVATQASGYVTARFFGAPAALAVFAVTGWLIGLGKTRAALVLQLVMNGANIVLNLLFVWGLGFGAAGVGLGTAGAEWIALAFGLVVAARVAGMSLLTMGRAAGYHTLFNRPAVTRLLAINRDIMVRTLAVLLLFTWFANAGSRLGAVPLAANHVLLQFISFAAFVLDAFAFTAESRIGHALGTASRQAFLRAIRLTGEFSLVAGILLSLVFWVSGEAIIAVITTDPATRAEAARFLPFAALVPLIGMPSWLLDGVFIGATEGKALRNAGVIATAIYLALDTSLRPLDNLGVWLAFCASYILRAGALGLYLPALMRSLPEDTPPAPEAKLL